MSTAHRHDNLVTAGAVRLAGLLVVAVVLLVALARMGLLPESPSAAEMRAAAHVRPVAERLLLFADRDGHVLVTDARSGAQVALLGQEGSGFVRGVMRGLARERRQHGFDGTRPFRLTAYADGELSMLDTATGRRVELTGFGATNRAAFARLLEVRP